MAKNTKPKKEIKKPKKVGGKKVQRTFSAFLGINPEARALNQGY